MRRFAIISGYRDRDLALPTRKTEGSAGYDLAAAEDVEVPPGGIAMVPTGCKAIMPQGEFLAVFIRSSLAVRCGLGLANGVGIIDSDYCDNPDNEGHILIAMRNGTEKPVRIARGERVAQGIFLAYGVTEDDFPGQARTGGFGSTGR